MSLQGTCLRRSLLSLSRYDNLSRAARTHTRLPRHLQTRSLTSDVESKYREKIARIAQEKGVSVEEIKSSAQEKKAQELQKQKEDIARYREKNATAQASAASASASGSASQASQFSPERKDCSPVKPLSSFFNLQKLMSTPHTPEQITALWSAYHASKSNGTGRGYLYATIPVDKYTKMLEIAQKYPSFLVPIPRAPSEPTEAPSADQSPYEFFFLQWGLHEAPPTPSAKTELDKLFEPKFVENNTNTNTNPALSTVLLTPLQEYKLRQTFATPFLVLTHYTDLVDSHGIVLLRGEITPSSTSIPGADPADGRYMLSQLDAQALALSVQKFYLWGGEGEESGKGEKLLRTFHEKPEEFKWEELLAYIKETSP